MRLNRYLVHGTPVASLDECFRSFLFSLKNGRATGCSPQPATARYHNGRPIRVDVNTTGTKKRNLGSVNGNANQDNNKKVIKRGKKPNKREPNNENTVTEAF
jgi:hypothetical protein